MNVQYVSDASGKPTAVLIPIKEWERLQKHLPEATTIESSAKEKFKAEFRAGVQEMRLMRESKLPKYPLRQFLSELDGEI